MLVDWLSVLQNNSNQFELIQFLILKYCVCLDYLMFIDHICADIGYWFIFGYFLITRYFKSLFPALLIPCSLPSGQ